MDSLLYIILSVVFAGTMLMLLDLPYVSGSILASGAGERIAVRILVPVLLLGGIVLPVLSPVHFIQMTQGLMKPEAVCNVLPVGIATAVTAVIILGFSRYAAVPFAFVAAVAGMGLACGGSLDFADVLPYVSSWIAAPLVCALVAAGIYSIFAATGRRRESHFAVTEGRFLSAATIVAFLLAIAAAVNNSIVFTFLPSGLGENAIWVVAGSALAILPFVFRHVTMSKWYIADYELDTNPQAIISLMLSMLVCFVLFTSPAPLRLGLAATPLPAGTLYLATLAGISLRSKRTLVDGPILLKGIISSYISPLLAFLLAFSLGRIMDGELTGTFIVLGIIVLIAGVIVYMRVQSQRIINQQVARAHEQQVYSTRKSLSALEVRAEMTEKDLLNKLDIKRKELVDFAVGISDQKDFMENVYEQLKEVRATREGAEKDARTDALLRSLRERMYFTREMNDFYTRSEELHKDFNERLAESFPKLTENERKLANLLRQGFSSKYIASLMNITPKSVEINRYRLRAKLGLARSENLINFIKSI
ncbi:MAG: hypothetical protein IKH89_07685 [Bacteroidales bacterium]|nr:hypothetical protein [Bacteroidales bacterium]